MNDETERRPSPLESLRELPQVPSTLEGRVVGGLRRRGLIGSPTLQRRRWLGWVGAAAASVAAFAIGRARRASAPPSSSTGRQWMLLLYDGADFDPIPPGGERERVEEYRRWVAAQRETGRQIDGAELAPAGEMLAPKGTAGFAGSSCGRISGYFVMTAASDFEARQVASTCPHLAHGGRVAVHPLL